MKVLILLVLLVSGSWAAQGQQVSKVVVYRAFLRAGSTARLSNAFRHPALYPGLVDTADVNRSGRLTGAVLTRLLSTATRTTHHQRKMGGVRYAGELHMAGSPHFFLYFPGEVLVDLTDRVNYRLNRSSQSALEQELAALLPGK